jgi:hypothetical protein
MAGLNTDTMIFGVLTLIFIVIGVSIPYIQAEFNVVQSHNDIPTIKDVNLGTILFSILKVVTYTFGDLPTWFDVCVMMPLRILYIVVIKKVFLI